MQNSKLETRDLKLFSRSTAPSSRVFCFTFPFLLACSFYLLSTSLQAQGTLRGQIFGPNGKSLAAEVRFQITSNDGNFQQFYFSDSNGRIVVPNLRPGKTYTLTIDSDGFAYESARESFNIETVQYLTIFLKPKAKSEKKRPSETVSVTALSRETPEDAARSYSEAVRLVDKGETANSVHLFEQAIERFPAFFEAHNDLGVVYLKLNRLTEAEKILRKATDINPKDHRPWLNLGIALIRQERYSDAIQPLKVCLELKPGFSDTHRYLGEALLEAGKLDEAEKELTAALAAGDSNRPTAMIKLAIVKVQKNDNTAAIRLLEEYLKVYPKASNRSEIEHVLKELRH